MEKCASSCGRQVGAASRNTGTAGLSESARARSEAHLRAEAPGGRRVVRGSARSARPQEWADHDALLGGRAKELDCRGGPGVRGKVPQIPHNHRFKTDRELTNGRQLFDSVFE